MNELAAILLKYGFADVIRRLGLSTPVEHAGKLVRSSMKPVSYTQLTLPTIGEVELWVVGG